MVLGALSDEAGALNILSRIRTARLMWVAAGNSQPTELFLSHTNALLFATEHAAFTGSLFRDVWAAMERDGVLCLGMRVKVCRGV